MTNHYFHVTYMDKIRVREGEQYPCAGISNNSWSSRILMWGKTEQDVTDLREYVLNKLNASDQSCSVWTACSDQMPESDTCVDVLCLSTKNEEFQQRVCDVTYTGEKFILPLGVERTLALLPYCYIGYWMKVPRLEL